MSTIKCDVLVVGGGPAGLTAGLFLSKNGFSTIILEKSKNVGPKQTKFDITEGTRINNILDEMGIKPNKKSSISEWISPNYNYILDSEIEDYYFERGLEKNSIESILSKKLSDNNIEVLLNTNIDSIKIEKKEVKDVTIKTNNEKIVVKTKYIIGADGSESDLINRLGIEKEIFATFRGIGLIIESEEQDEIPHAKIYLNEKLAPGGYIYSGSVNNKSFFCIVIDNIFSKEEKFQENLKHFLKQRLNREITSKNYFSGIGTSGIHKNHIKNLFLVGGAALFCDPFLGYGLNYAIESAYYAAKAIIKNNIELYAKYTKNVQNEFKEMFFAREIWRKADNDFFDKLIRTFNAQYEPKEKEIIKIIELFGE